MELHSLAVNLFKIRVVKETYSPCLVLKAGAVCLLFNCWFTTMILNKSTVSESRKVLCDGLCGESKSFME